MTIPLSKLQPALLKSKEVATIQDVDNISTKASLLEVRLAALDGKVTEKERELTSKILQEEQDRIADIEARIHKEAELDGKITAEEEDRINAITLVNSAYRKYSQTVTKALADGVLTQEEQELISDAAEAVQIAKNRLTALDDGIVDNSTKIAGITEGNIPINVTGAIVNGKTLTNYVSEEVDKKVVVYSGNDHSTQSGMKINDIYIEKTVELSSKGIPIDVVNTYRYNGTSWISIGNNSNLTALADLADNKRTVYTTTTEPDNADPGDLWIDPSNNLIKVYSGTSWNNTTNSTSETTKVILENVLNGSIPLNDVTVMGTRLTDYIDTFNNKVTVYSGDDHNSVSTPNEGDIYIENTFDTDSLGNTVPTIATWKYENGAWLSIGTSVTLSALRDVSDGKRNVFTTNNTPTPPYQRGDLWCRNNKIKVATITRAKNATGSSTDWSNAANHITNTAELVDGAGLGQTAYWPEVTGSGKPADNADVTKEQLAGKGINLVPYEVATIDLTRAWYTKSSGYPILRATVTDTYPSTISIHYDKKDKREGWIQLNVPMRLKKGLKYIFSYDINNSNHNKMYSKLVLHTSAGTEVSSIPAFRVGRWTRKYVTIHPLTNDSNVYIKFYAKMAVDTGNYEVVLIKNIMLEEALGNQTTPSPYVPPTNTVKESLEKSLVIGAGGIVLRYGGDIQSYGANFNTNKGVFLGTEGTNNHKFLAGNGDNYIKFSDNALSVHANEVHINAGINNSFILDSNPPSEDAPNIKGAIIEASATKGTPLISVNFDNELYKVPYMQTVNRAHIYSGGIQNKYVVFGVTAINESSMYTSSHVDYTTATIANVGEIEINGTLQIKGSCTWQLQFRLIDMGHYWSYFVNNDGIPWDDITDDSIARPIDSNYSGYTIRHGSDDAKIYPYHDYLKLDESLYSGDTSKRVLIVAAIKTSGDSDNLVSYRTTFTRTQR